MEQIWFLLMTSDSWRPKHIMLPHPDHIQVALQKILTICSVPQCGEPAQWHEIYSKKECVEHLDMFPSLEHVQIITESESQLPPPRHLLTELYPSSGAPLSDFIIDPWERDTQGYLETIVQISLQYPIATSEEYKYIPCGIKKNGIKTYYDNMLMEENTTLCFPSFRNGDDIQKLVPSMPGDLAPGGWELHNLIDMIWKDNNQCRIKSWSWDVMRSMGWLMWQQAYRAHLIYAPQCCFMGNSPPNCLYTEMHTADLWWETHVWRNTWG